MVNFDKLSTQTLQRYKRVYKLDVADDAGRDKLVHTIASHFTKEKAGSHTSSISSSIVSLY
jgi:hypothetical protein